MAQDFSEAPKPKMQMLFSAQAQNTSTEEGNALSFYIEENQWSRLLELLTEFNSLKIYKLNNDVFRIEIAEGQHVIEVSKDFHKTMITLLNIDVLTPGAAELLAKIADLLFYDRKRRFMVNGVSLSYEQIAWEACFKLDIPLKPENSAQAARFNAWEQEKRNMKKLEQFGFAQAASVPKKADPSGSDISKK